MSKDVDEYSGDAEQRADEQAIDPAVTSGQSTVAQGILQRYADSPGVIPMAHARALFARSAWPGAGLPLLADIQRRHGSFGRSGPDVRGGLVYAPRLRAATMRPSSALARKQAFPVEASMPAVLAHPAAGAMPATAEFGPELAPGSDLGSRSGEPLAATVQRSQQDPALAIGQHHGATSGQSIMPATAEHGPELAPTADLASRSSQPLTVVVQRSQQDPAMAIHPDRSATSAQSIMPRAVAHGPELAPASGPAHRFGEPVVAIVQRSHQDPALVIGQHHSATSAQSVALPIGQMHRSALLPKTVAGEPGRSSESSSNADGLLPARPAMEPPAAAQSAGLARVAVQETGLGPVIVQRRLGGSNRPTASLEEQVLGPVQFPETTGSSFRRRPGPDAPSASEAVSSVQRTDNSTAAGPGLHSQVEPNKTGLQRAAVSAGEPAPLSTRKTSTPVVQPAPARGKNASAERQLARLALPQTAHAAGNLGKPVMQRQLDNADGRAIQMNDAMDGISQPLGRVVTHSPHSAVAPLPPGQHRREAAFLWPDDAPFTRPDAAPPPSMVGERSGVPAVQRQIAATYPSPAGVTDRVMRQPLTLDSRAKPRLADGLSTIVWRATAAGAPAAGSGGPSTPAPTTAAELPTMSRAEAVPEVDLQRLTDQVYHLLVRRLASERERRGL